MSDRTLAALTMLSDLLRETKWTRRHANVHRILDSASRSLGRRDAAGVAVAQYEITRALTHIGRHALLRPDQIAAVRLAMRVGPKLAKAYENYLLTTAPANHIPV